MVKGFYMMHSIDLSSLYLIGLYYEYELFTYCRTLYVFHTYINIIIYMEKSFMYINMFTAVHTLVFFWT